MKLLLTGASNYSVEQLNQIESLGYELNYVEDERVPLQVDVSKFDAVVCNGLFLYNDISQFKRLKFVQVTSSGLDRIPLKYIKEHGIRLYSAKGVYSAPMAEWVILKILEICKKSKNFYEAQKAHKWEKERSIIELTDKTATIIGLGDVGLEVAKKLKAFNVNSIGVGRKEMKSEFLNEFHLVGDVDCVLENSDIVILTLPLNEETTHFINNKKIALMKEESILINVSRGKIIDETALIAALCNGKFLGVALDVFEEEPLNSDSPLWDISRVHLTPHNSFISDKIGERLFYLILNNLKLFKSSF